MQHKYRIKIKLDKMILVAFDEKDPSPLFDGNHDTKVRNIEIEETE